MWHARQVLRQLQLGPELGAGASGVVCLGRDALSGRLYAVKMFSKKKLGTAATAAGTLDEAQRIASLMMKEAHSSDDGEDDEEEDSDDDSDDNDQAARPEGAHSNDTGRVARGLELLPPSQGGS